MKNITKHTFAIIGIFLILILGLSAYYTYATLGFPDGHLTEYDRFYKRILYPSFLVFNFLFALLFIRTIYLKKKQRLLFMVYLVLFVLFTIVEFYLSTNLENGQGE
ncbi:hypothetical protein [Ascidiimonas sp. W6]|uniref:hypothetical protein n=1 Tax=Ascidiimonas meishanensis TaxID=3128903 RepID=UPI0030ECD447